MDVTVDVLVVVGIVGPGGIVSGTGVDLFTALLVVFLGF